MSQWMVTSFLINNKDNYKYKDVFVSMWCCKIARYVLQSAMYKSSLDLVVSCLCTLRMWFNVPDPPSTACFVCCHWWLAVLELWNGSCIIPCRRNSWHMCMWIWLLKDAVELIVVMHISPEPPPPPKKPIKILLFHNRPHPMAIILHSPSMFLGTPSLSMFLDPHYIEYGKHCAPH